MSTLLGSRKFTLSCSSESILPLRWNYTSDSIDFLSLWVEEFSYVYGQQRHRQAVREDYSHREMAPTTH